MTVLAAHTWPDNASLIADVWSLYGFDDAIVLDPTWGRGLWWKKVTPKNLIRHDKYKLDGVDFTQRLPEAPESIDIVAFDPPYVSVGGRKTTGLPEMHDRYGLTDAAKSPYLLQCDINIGISNCYRVLKPGGLLWVKCQDYISSGKFWPGTYNTQLFCLERHRSFEQIDRFEMVGSPRSQPPNRRQVHARRNLSTLLIFRKVK